MEGPWSDGLKGRKSIRPLLELAQTVGDIPFVHVPVYSRDALESIVQMWRQRQYSRYSFGYFAFHGAKGRILIDRESITLPDLGEMLRGVCQDRIVYFGSCSTLRVSKEEISAFLKETGARAVLGYTKEVDWFESAAFDLLLLDALTRFQRPDAIDRWPQKRHPDMCERLGFRVHTPASVARRIAAS